VENLKLTVLEDFDQFINLKDEWNKTLVNSKDNNVFSTWEWLYCWWKHFGKNRQLKILLATENDSILGIAPLMISRYSFLKFGNFSKLEFIGTPEADYNNFIFTKKERECLRLFLDYAINECDEWDCLELREIPMQSISTNLLEPLNTKDFGGTPVAKTTVNVCPYITLPSDMETFLRTLDGGTRYNLRRYSKKLSSNYNVAVATQKDFETLEKAMAAFYRLHQKRWEAEGRSGVFSKEVYRSFNNEVAQHFDKKGWLDLIFLTANREPVAAMYTFDYQNKKYAYLSGFDPQFSRYSVGNILILHVVERSIQKGLKECDLMRGDEPYKWLWTTNARTNIQVQVIRKGIYARMYGWVTRNKSVLSLTRKLGLSLSPN